MQKANSTISVAAASAAHAFGQIAGHMTLRRRVMVILVVTACRTSRSKTVNHHSPARAGRPRSIIGSISPRLALPRSRSLDAIVPPLPDPR
jgi:hypothetical protein